MFGYVLPYIPHLKVCENETYKAIYCGLCKQIKKRYGMLSRLFLSYDMVFYAIFCIGYLDKNINFERKFCKIHPFKKRNCLENCGVLKKTADVGVILFYFKLKDNVLDCKYFKKILNIILLLLFKKSYKKAVKYEQNISDSLSNLNREQICVENKTGMSLDYYSHPTANCMGLIFKELAKNDKHASNLYRLGYMLGKYIYILDAVDDIEKDYRKERFNPIIRNKKFNISNISKVNSKTIFNSEILKEANELMNFCIAQLAESFESLKIKKWASILKNIIYLGLKSEKDRIIKKYCKQI